MLAATVTPKENPPVDMLYERINGEFVEKTVSAYAVWPGRSINGDAGQCR